MDTNMDYEKAMQLPPGKTCADCYAIKFCLGIGCTTLSSTKCDYHPNRFRQCQTKTTPPTGRPPSNPIVRPERRSP